MIVQVTNHGKKAESEGLIWAYLVDAEGRRWEETAGVTGGVNSEGGRGWFGGESAGF